MRFIQAFFLLIGRIAISVVFIAAALGKILNWDSTLEFMRSHSLSEHTDYMLLGAVAVELIGGLAFAFGCLPKLAATALALFLIPTTYFIHNFWTLTDPAAMQMQQTEFLKNLAIFGGLICYIASSQCSQQKPAPAKPTEK
jgi:putative oxidoreductase